MGEGTVAIFLVLLALWVAISLMKEDAKKEAEAEAKKEAKREEDRLSN